MGVRGRSDALQECQLKDQGRRFPAYAEGPKLYKVRTRRVCGRCTRKSNSKSLSVRERSVCADPNSRSHDLTVYAEGLATFLLIAMSSQKSFVRGRSTTKAILQRSEMSFCTQKVRAKLINSMHLVVSRVSC